MDNHGRQRYSGRDNPSSTSLQKEGARFRKPSGGRGKRRGKPKGGIGKQLTHSSVAPSHSTQHDKSASQQYPKRVESQGNGKPAITIIVNRVDLHDSGANVYALEEPDVFPQEQESSAVDDYCFKAPATNVVRHETSHDSSVGVLRVPYAVKIVPADPTQPFVDPVVDSSIPNPHDPSIDKYWAQRRRLFSKFDQGIKLDKEGWFSVTPEIIAEHVSDQVCESAKSKDCKGLILLDAFCGCGGNGIAFAKSPQTSLVVCVDTDRSKLRKAAHNASIYQIPKDKMVFVECNSVFILKHCYEDGEFVLDRPREFASAPMQMPNPVPTEVFGGYQIGGINMLPRKIDAVFMDPPWGGVDYGVLGKNGYDLEKNMKIRCQTLLTEASTGRKEPCHDTVSDDFFDSFCSQPLSQKQKKANFNANLEDDEVVNGAELLRMAAASTGTRLVAYDLPKNTNKVSLGHAALSAGYRGNCKLDEHHLNGRLKTVTAYFGTCSAKLLRDPPSSTIPNRFQSSDSESTGNMASRED